jgi:hypothetical protein
MFAWRRGTQRTAANAANRGGRGENSRKEIIVFRRVRCVRRVTTTPGYFTKPTSITAEYIFER